MTAAILTSPYFWFCAVPLAAAAIACADEWLGRALDRGVRGVGSR